MARSGRRSRFENWESLSTFEPEGDRLNTAVAAGALAEEGQQGRATAAAPAAEAAATANWKPAYGGLRSRVTGANWGAGPATGPG